MQARKTYVFVSFRGLSISLLLLIYFFARAFCQLRTVSVLISLQLSANNKQIGMAHMQMFYFNKLLTKTQWNRISWQREYN